MVGSWYVLVMCEKEPLLWTLLLASNGWKTTKFDLIDDPCPPTGLFVCLSAQNFLVFVRNHLVDWDEVFTIGATSHVECFNDKYDVIGHVVWQPYRKIRKTLDLCISETAPSKKWNLAHGKYSSWGTSVILWRHRCPRYDDIIAYVERHIRLVWKFWGSSRDKNGPQKNNHDIIGHVIRQPYCFCFF